MPKHVYFLKPIGQDGPVKIGCSIDPKSRLNTLSIWSPIPLEMIASAPGGTTEENDLHWHFAGQRLHGEWFSVSQGLLGVIEHVKTTGELPAIPSLNYREKAKRPGTLKRRGNPDWTKAKAQLSGRLRRAERHAHGYWEAERPQRIKDLVASYSGVFTPPPAAETVAEIEAHIASLLARPKADRSHAAWEAWSNQRNMKRAA